MTSPPRILYCHCQYAQVVPPEVKEAVLRKLAESGVAFAIGEQSSKGIYWTQTFGAPR